MSSGDMLCSRDATMRTLQLAILAIAGTLSAPAYGDQPVQRNVTLDQCNQSETQCLGLCARLHGVAFEAGRKPLCEASCNKQYDACKETGERVVDAQRAVF